MPQLSQSSEGLVFFFNDTATTEIYTLSLHDALPIYSGCVPISEVVTISSSTRAPDAARSMTPSPSMPDRRRIRRRVASSRRRSEEHTSELQSRQSLVCRLLLEKKKLFTHVVNGRYIS